MLSAAEVRKLFHSAPSAVSQTLTAPSHEADAKRSTPRVWHQLTATASFECPRNTRMGPRTPVAATPTSHSCTLWSEVPTAM